MFFFNSLSSEAQLIVFIIGVVAILIIIIVSAVLFFKGRKSTNTKVTESFTPSKQDSKFDFINSWIRNINS